MEAILSGLELLLQPLPLLMLFSGVIGGIVVGALPGLTATMGVAILVPFSFGMEPVPGLLMLLGLYAGAIYGGSVAAILINTPGTPSAAATILDGTPLFNKGEAGRAIGMATFASVFGGIGSAIFLVTLAPLLSRFALAFSAPEYFALAVLGITIIGSISSGSLAKGLLSGCIGLIIATIGMDPIQGYTRYTFGTVNLMGGVPFIPALIGLFAVSEAITQFERLIEPIKEEVNLKKLIPSFSDIKRVMRTMLKSTVIGTFVGALPGAGGDIASFVCYNEAQRSSKHPETFGTGEIEGVAAAETGNNASTGGALIPTLSLGVPGDSVTAIIIGALMVQGLRPGPLLFRDHLDIVNALFIGFIAANVFFGIFGLMMAGFLSKLIMISKRSLIPIIMVLAIVGSFAMQNNIFDIFLMLLLGIFGYLVRKINVPLGPIVLALILGPMVEENFRKSLVMSYGDYSVFFVRPISAVLLLLALISVITTIVRERKGKHLPGTE
ncbi:C4-dicarboxylate ABC transporter permease [Marispirochaeta aestuarii]|uniref:C4-dicarboxylate ABC transporter permease n=1 Tax=Marispirochaeta aestuarii TaxID=1963862 RepID=A0A1Y1S0C2_9SPIO|nr:tripartite tricarboxylate transporter permease [Marispirochaeta aestuarii]ORC36633.1 C4-dicarboxylate ABC transporter permease [Marispirochaeta aestuarii]